MTNRKMMLRLKARTLRLKLRDLELDLHDVDTMRACGMTGAGGDEGIDMEIEKATEELDEVLHSLAYDYGIDENGEPVYCPF